MNDELPTLDPTPNPDPSSGHGSDFIPPKGSPARMPKQIGKYRIKKLIGTGGMGSVYQAVQEQPRRNVAIKLMKSGVTSSSALRRFEYESQLLARLRHPGIAEVYDAGTHEAHDGSVPYFVMEYIPGAKRITDYVRDKKLGTRERLNLFLEVASAVHHGHTKGIIHRDLKPDNIIVDSHGRVKVIDFGVARATDSDMAVTTMQTDIGQLIGTVQYMSPEQVEAEPDDLDTRSDVYSLGVVLYEILCGKLPYDVSKMKIYDATRVVRDQEAMRLSTVDSTLRGDVETIVSKALEKDRDRRYQSAQELAADIGRYLKDEAIMARPPSLTYQVRVFTRRNKAVVTGVAAVFAALLLGLAGMSYLYVDTIRARNAEQEKSELAEQNAIKAEAAKTAAIKATETANLRAQTINRNLYYNQMIMAGHVFKNPDGLGRVKELTDNWFPQTNDPESTEDLRGWEWYYLRSQLQQAIRTFDADHARWTPDGIRLFIQHDDGSLTVTESDTGLTISTLPPGSYPIKSTHDLSQDGTRLAVAMPEGEIILWNLETGRQIRKLAGHDTEATQLSWSPEGSRLASANSDIGRKRSIKIWNTHTGEPTLWEATGNSNLHPRTKGTASPRKLIWNSDATRLAVSFKGTSKILSIFDTSTGENIIAHNANNPSLGGQFSRMAWNRNSTRIAGSHSDGSILLINSASGQVLQTLTSHDLPLLALAWSPNGKRLASAGFDKTVKLWDIESQPAKLLHTFRGHADMVNHLHWNADSTRLLSHGIDDQIKLWNANAWENTGAPPAQNSKVISPVWSPNGQHIAWIRNNTQLIIWNTQTHQETTANISNMDTELMSLAWRPDGERLASGTNDGQIIIWNVKTPQQMGKLSVSQDEKNNNVKSIAWRHDGAFLVSACQDNTVKIWNMQSLQEVAQLSGHQGPVNTVAWSPDGLSIASGSDDATFRIWDAKTNQLQRVIQYTHDILKIVFSPDSKQLLTRSFGGLHIWDANTGDLPLATLKGHSNMTSSVAWSHEGTRIASTSLDNTLKIWDTNTAQETLSLGGEFYDVSWSHNDQHILAVSRGSGGAFTIWDAQKGYDEEHQRLAREPASGQDSEQTKSTTP